MTSPHGTLVSLHHALDRLLANCEPVEPAQADVSKASGLVSAGRTLVPRAAPVRMTALRDGWAVRASDAVGASAYAPVLPAVPPIWIEAGMVLPERCDSVLEPQMVEQSGPVLQIVADIAPGAGIRRAGSDLVQGDELVPAGRKIDRRDVMLAGAVGLSVLNVRQPRVRIINVAAQDGFSSTAQFIAAAAADVGGEVSNIGVFERDVQQIADALGAAGECDLVLIVGGTGQGRADATAEALKAKNALIAHGVALEPGRSAAIGRLGRCPVIALPGLLGQALAVWWTLALPVLDRLSGYRRSEIVRPLTRKVASAPGMAEIVLLRAEAEGWEPLSTGDIPYACLARADAWTLVPGDSEGYAAGAPLGAFSISDSI